MQSKGNGMGRVTGAHRRGSACCKWQKKKTTRPCSHNSLLACHSATTTTTMPFTAVSHKRSCAHSEASQAPHHQHKTQTRIIINIIDAQKRARAALGSVQNERRILIMNIQKSKWYRITEYYRTESFLQLCCRGVFPHPTLSSSPSSLCQRGEGWQGRTSNVALVISWGNTRGSVERVWWYVYMCYMSYNLCVITT